MKAAIYLTTQYPPGSDMVSALQEQLLLVREARDRGWDAVASGQHYLSEGMVQLQLVPFLARVAAEAGSMTGIAAVMLLPLHNPVEVAEQVASLDVLWKGNLVFGVGLGYRREEFAAFGVPWEARIRRFEETLALVKRLWTGEAVTAESVGCRLENISMTARPVQRPHPPIWVAATADAGVRRAARLGDAWLIGPHATLPTIRRQLALYQAERLRAGFAVPLHLPVLREIFCARDRETALATAGPALAAKYGAYTRWRQDDALPGEDAFDRPLDELCRDRFILGSPEECHEDLSRYLALGVDHLLLRMHWPGLPLSASLQSLRLLSDEVLPALRRREPAAAPTTVVV
jgi:alkanesulfonate monooxygenase SsuD/methylene tetrahydromethanopterin reductase-like flavin-dependent oxidoreductase (luciferase family)